MRNCFPLLLIPVFILLIKPDTGSSQNPGMGINVMGAAPNSKALLDIDAVGMSPKKGLLIPRMTTAERDAIAATASENSLLIFNTDVNCFQAYNGILFQWENVYCWAGCTGVPLTPGTITGNGAPCQNATGVSYSIAQVSGATSYTWSVPSGATITSGQGTTGIVVDFSTFNGNISVTASNSCGTSPVQAIPVSLVPPPLQPSAVTGNSTICQGETGSTYSVVNVAGVTYTWSYSGNGFTITSGQGTNSITVNYSGATSGTLTVTPSSSCGSGTAGSLAITVNSATPGSQTFSSSGSFTVPACITSITVEVWAGGGGGGGGDNSSVGVVNGGGGGGGGGKSTSTLSVTPGSVYNVIIGGGGGGTGPGCSGAGGAGGSSDFGGGLVNASGGAGGACAASGSGGGAGGSGTTSSGAGGANGGAGSGGSGGNAGGPGGGAGGGANASGTTPGGGGGGGNPGTAGGSGAAGQVVVSW